MIKKEILTPGGKIEFAEIAGGRVILAKIIRGQISSREMSGALVDAGYPYGYIKDSLSKVSNLEVQFPVAKTEILIEPPRCRYSFTNPPELENIIRLENLSDYQFPSALKKVEAGDILFSIESDTELLCRYPGGGVICEKTFGPAAFAALAGANTSFSLSERTITADCKGYGQIEQDGTVSVQPARWRLELGNDFKQAEFMDALHIAGDLLDTQNVQLSASLNVAGKIKDCSISLPGTLSCGEEIVNRRIESAGLISVGDDLSAYAIENTKIQCGGSIYVKSHITGSNVEARDSIVCGTVENAELRAGNKVVVQDVLKGSRIKVGFGLLENQQLRELAAATLMPEFRVDEAGQSLQKTQQELIALRKQATAHVMGQSQKGRRAKGPDLVLQRFCRSLRELTEKYQKFLSSFREALEQYEAGLPIICPCPTKVLFIDSRNLGSWLYRIGNKNCFPGKNHHCKPQGSPRGYQVRFIQTES